MEVELLRAVMRSLRWKNAAIHPQLQLENSELRAKVAMFQQNESVLIAEIAQLRAELERALAGAATPRPRSASRAAK